VASGTATSGSRARWSVSRPAGRSPPAAHPRPPARALRAARGACQSWCARRDAEGVGRCADEALRELLADGGVARIVRESVLRRMRAADADALPSEGLRAAMRSLRAL